MLLIFGYLSFNVTYLFLFALAGAFKKGRKYSSTPYKRKIGILVPSYKEDAIIIETVRNAIRQDYPKDRFEVIVIGDQLQTSTLTKLAEFPIRLIEVKFDKSTKAKALKYALQHSPDNFCDVVMILDADNLMGNGCLEKINAAFESGYSMVQLHRSAKNKNTPTAILDAMSEEINNHIFRKGHRALNLSSALIGSGMAFGYSSFKSVMMDSDIENNPGEDREIFLGLLKEGKICEYIDDGLVYDEKVQSPHILKTQRTRWISAQLQYAKRFWITEFLGTFSFNIHYFDYALQTLLLPRIIVLLGSAIMMVLALVLHFFIGTGLFPGLSCWIVLFFIFILSMIMSVWSHVSFKEILTALRSLPRTAYSFVIAIAKSRANQEDFVSTPKAFLREDIETSKTH